MYQINDHLNPAVQNLLKSLGVEIKLLSETIVSDNLDEWRASSIMVNTTLPTQGLYYGPTDTIVLNDSDLGDATPVVLHELIHWSGAESRLKREWILNNVKDIESFWNGTYVKDDSEEFTKGQHTEEAIAEIGMFKLMLLLGIEPMQYQERVINYLKYLSSADLMKADLESDIAVEYLVSFIGMEMVA